MVQTHARLDPGESELRLGNANSVFADLVASTHTSKAVGTSDEGPYCGPHHSSSRNWVSGLGPLTVESVDSKHREPVGSPEEPDSMGKSVEGAAAI
ncbi:hypothetical protein PI125_g20161 [Phytophthora idaei]|nr:hypothetical protein PI125_g20161 [Phytophthora idaei]